MIFCPVSSAYEAQVRPPFWRRCTATNKKGLTGVKVWCSVFALLIRLMFASCGIEFGSDGNGYLELVRDRFGGTFPTINDFSNFARELTIDRSLTDCSDATLIEWMETPESMFRKLEKHIVWQRLRAGLGDNGDDADEFVRFSISVQNRVADTLSRTILKRC